MKNRNNNLFYKKVERFLKENNDDDFNFDDFDFESLLAGDGDGDEPEKSETSTTSSNPKDSDDFVSFDDFDFESLLSGDSKKAEEAGIDKETAKGIARQIAKSKKSDDEFDFDVDSIMDLGGSDTKEYWNQREIDPSRLNPYNDDTVDPANMHTSKYYTKKAQMELSQLFPDVMNELMAHKPMYRARFEMIVSLQNKLTKALVVLPGDTHVRNQTKKDDDAKGNYDPAKDAATFKLSPATLLGYEEIEDYVRELDKLIIELTSDSVKDKENKAFDKKLISLWDKVHAKIKYVANNTAEKAYYELLDKTAYGDNPELLEKKAKAFKAWKREQEKESMSPYTGLQAYKSAIDFAVGESRDSTLTNDEIGEILDDIEKSESSGDKRSSVELLIRGLKSKLNQKYSKEFDLGEDPSLQQIRDEALASGEPSEINGEPNPSIPDEADVELEIDELARKEEKDLFDEIAGMFNEDEEHKMERARLAVEYYKGRAERVRKNKAMWDKVWKGERQLVADDPVMVKYREALNKAATTGEFDFIEVLKQVEESLKERSFSGKSGKRGLVYREMTALTGGRLKATSGARHDTIHIIQLFNWMNVNPKGRAEIVSYMAKKYFDLFEILDLIDHEYINVPEDDDAFSDSDLLDDLSDHFTDLKKVLTDSTEDLETYFDIFDDKKFGEDFFDKKLNAQQKYAVADTFLHDSGFRHFSSELLADYYNQLGNIITARLYTAMKHFFEQPKYSQLGAFKSYKPGGGDEYAIAAGRREFGEVANIIAYFAMNRTHTKEELKLVRNRFDLEQDAIKKFKEKMISTIKSKGNSDVNSVSSKIVGNMAFVSSMVDELVALISDRTSEFGSARLDWLEFNSGLVEDFKLWLEDTTTWRKFNKQKMGGSQEDLELANATLSAARAKRKKDIAKGKFAEKKPKKKEDVGPYNKIGNALKQINLQNYAQLYERFVKAIVLNQVDIAMQEAKIASGKGSDYYEPTLDDDETVIAEVNAAVEGFESYIELHAKVIKDLIKDDPGLVED
jgi:hypothetical protein